MRHKKKNNKISTVIENVTVLEMAAEGKCVSRHDNKVLFTEYTAPGDIVDLRIVRDKKSFAMGVPIQFHSYSKDRSEPFCQHFGTCGGCKWQHINYAKQIEYKATQVKDALERIAKIDYPSINPILGSAKTTFYRNKLEFTFSNKKWLTTEELESEEQFQKDALGFHIAGRFDKILDIQTCYLQSELSNEIRNTLRDFAKANSISFFDIRVQKGLLRNLIIRNSEGTGQLMVIVQFFDNDQEGILKVMELLRNTFPQITSLLYVINSKGNETFHDLDLICYAGQEYILEEMEGLQFRIGPKSFYQTNSSQAYELYKIVRQMAQLKGDELVYDLYTGTGTIANFIAKSCRRVVGMEYVEMAVEDARKNSITNNLANTEFYAGDIKDLLSKDLVEKIGIPQLVITDPPRAGMHEDVVKMLLEIAPEKIVYVSCNPATQARDLALMDEKYVIKEVQPVDMFPHTYHVENVVLLHKR